MFIFSPATDGAHQGHVAAAEEEAAGTTERNREGRAAVQAPETQRSKHQNEAHDQVCDL